MQAEFKAILFDIDGVLEFQGRAYPGAPELLDFLRGVTSMSRLFRDLFLLERSEPAANAANAVKTKPNIKFPIKIQRYNLNISQTDTYSLLFTPQNA